MYQSTEEASRTIKPLNLPKSDWKLNVMTFFYLFEMSMRGTNDITKSTALINALDSVSVEVIMLQIPDSY